MKPIFAFLLLVLVTPAITYAEEITQNQAYCLSIASASTDTISLLCLKTPRAEIITKLKTKYHAISSEIESLVETHSNLYSENICSQGLDKTFNNSFGACYAALQSMNGK